MCTLTVTEFFHGLSLTTLLEEQVGLVFLQVVHVAIAWGCIATEFFSKVKHFIEVATEFRHKTAQKRTGLLIDG